MSYVGHILGDPTVLEEPRRNAIKRIRGDPGIPDAESSTDSFWITHAKKRVAQDVPERLPEKTDVLVIGSGVSGVSVSHNLLDASSVPVNGHEKPKFTVTLLEARDFCSGATGRNGGHIAPYADDYTDLKSALGEEEAKKIVSFRFEHVKTLVSLANELGIAEETQARELELVNVYLDKNVFDAAVKNFSEFQADKAAESSHHVVYDRDEARIKFGLPEAAGAICHPAGAVWPYKLMTALVSRLQRQYHDRFQLITKTPALKISIDAQTDGAYPHEVTTPRGVIRAKHVVHCTEGHQGHLIPNFRGIILPFRGQMSAQKPGNRFTHQGNDRSWIIQYEEGYDYLTQLPVTESVSDGEMMFGGGLLVTTKYGLNEIGVSKDDRLNMRIKAHLNGALNAVFGEESWGSVPNNAVKAMWTGIMAFSADYLPWVGKLPSTITSRGRLAQQDMTAGEWISSGFSGDGMVLAWRSGKALAQMIRAELQGNVGSGSERHLEAPEWLPRTFLISEDRFNQARSLSDTHYSK